MRKKSLVLPLFLAVSAPAVVFADEAPRRGGDDLSDEAVEEKLEVGAAPVEKVSREQASDDSKAKKKKKKHAKDEDEDDDDDADEDKDDKDKDDAKDDDEDEEDKPAPTKRGKPRLHIEGNYSDIELRRVEHSVSVQTSAGSGFGVISSSACLLPCDEVIDGRKGAQFYFAAPGMIPSARFSLGNQKGDIVARVKGGSAGVRIGGYVLTALGGTSMIMGVTAVALSADLSFFSPKFGWVSLGVGAGMLAGGIVMLVTSGTSFEIVPRTKEDAGIRFEGGRILF